MGGTWRPHGRGRGHCRPCRERGSALTDFHALCLGIGYGDMADLEVDYGYLDFHPATEPSPSLSVLANHTAACGQYLDEAIDRKTPFGIR